jgi:outer membrane protein OmpA-like peptidoglycan-associated protein
MGSLAVFYASDAALGAPDEALMDRGGMASSLPRLLAISTPSFVLALAFLAAALPATAQTIVGGETTKPAVTVDQGVLDSLGPAPTLPELLLGRRPEGRAALAPHPQARHGSVLHPPRKKKKAVAKAKPKHETPPVAARPAAPIAPVAATAPAVPRESVTTTPLAEPAPAPNPPASPEASAPAPATPPAAPTPPAAAATTAPAVAPPGPVPTAAPSPAAIAAMNTPPTLAPAAPAPTPVTPAAAPAAIAAAAGDRTRILFAAGAADLPDAAKAELDALVQRLNANGQARLQLIAHASGTADQANQARRVSLQRALAVRSYLMERGVANTRMDVRALGNRTDGNADDPSDRVDVVMLDR